MIYLLISIISILLTIFIVIGTHEFAHFIAARLLGVKIIRFSIGFGKTLFRWHDKKHTEYVIALIPLGGYVKMLDEREESVDKKDLPQAFNRQPFYKKFLIVLAGPVVNILCALFFYWALFMIGFVVPKPIIGAITPHSIAAVGGLKPQQEILTVDEKQTLTWTSVLFGIILHAGNQDELLISVQNLDKSIKQYSLNLEQWSLDKLSPDPFKSLGIAPLEPQVHLTIAAIKQESPAARYGLQVNDKILAVDKIPMKTWNEVLKFIHEHPQQQVLFTVQRQHKTMNLLVTVGSQLNNFHEQGYLGVSPTIIWPTDFFRTIQYGPLQAFFMAIKEVKDFVIINFTLISKLVTGKISLQSLGGPISIFQSAGEALNYGFIAFLNFLAFISIAVGVMNLLPIPGLDGSHLLIQIIESISGKPLPEKLLLNFYRLGFILILFLMLQTFINDILRF